MIYYPNVINDDTDPTEIIQKWESRAMLDDVNNKINISIAFELLGGYIMSNDYYVKPCSVVVPTLFPILKRLLNDEEYEMKWQDINKVVIKVLETYPKEHMKMLEEHKALLADMEFSLFNNFCNNFNN
jgi:hypothetical protein